MMRAGRHVIALLVCVLGCAGVGAIDTDAITDPALRARYERITTELRCLVCQNQTIADSNAELAVDLRRQVRQMLEEGTTDRAIRTYMVERYGDFILYKPPLRARTYALWFGPVLFLLAGAWLVWRVVAGHAGAPGDGDSNT